MRLLISGSSPALDSQGRPALQGATKLIVSGWFLHTHPIPQHVGQLGLVRKRAGLAPKIASIPRAFGSRCQFLADGSGRIPDLNAPRSSRGQGQTLFCSKTLVGGDGLVGEKQSAPLALPDHGLNRIEQVTSRGVGIAEFARCLQVVPGNLEGILDQSRQRLNHAEQTPSRPSRSFR